jgi:hypothetical protein
MKRIVRAAVVLLMPIAAFVVIAVVTSPRGLPAQAQAALDEYQQFQRSLSAQPVAVRQAVEAARPQDFSPQLSGGSFSSSVYFRTTYNYTSRGDYLRALPFPPEDLWCLLLAESDGSVSQVVFVGLHGDMYKAEWVVHEPAQGSSRQTVAANLSSVGCDLKYG